MTRKFVKIIAVFLSALLVVQGLIGCASNVAPPSEGAYYYDVENVVLYLNRYHELPPNYITKKEAEALGWQGGSVEAYREDAAIGGDDFGNYEKKLPEKERYRECDIDTHHGKNRGARRLVFTESGKYYYSEDHYEHFAEVRVNDDGSVSIGEAR